MPVCAGICIYGLHSCMCICEGPRVRLCPRVCVVSVLCVCEGQLSFSFPENSPWGDARSSQQKFFLISVGQSQWTANPLWASGRAPCVGWGLAGGGGWPEWDLAMFVRPSGGLGSVCVCVCVRLVQRQPQEPMDWRSFPPKPRPRPLSPHALADVGHNYWTPWPLSFSQPQPLICFMLSTIFPLLVLPLSRPLVFFSDAPFFPG